MMIPIFFISSIFIAVAFIVTENNAKYLLSGFNTMSEDERQQIDIKSHISYFKKFHIFLGVSLLGFASILFYFVDPNLSGIFMTIYPLVAYIYFILKSNQFKKVQSKKQTLISYLGIGVLIVLSLGIFYNFKNSLKDHTIQLSNNIIQIKGDYGVKINIYDLKSIELVSQLPEISYKINGFALGTTKKGYFKTKKGEKVKLLINSQKMPILLLTTIDNHKIYFSSNNKSNIEIYNQIKQKLPVN
ncbi:DUF3784 domain-containing protein [Flavobacterium sp.]|uniref:DUF3784 domain-containing protein n=1 Tax=Flavobacterium sp. TaxID=239 RepID=UPI003C392037